MFNAVFDIISVISRQPVYLSCFPGVLFNQYSAQYSFQVTGCCSTYPLSKQRTAVKEDESCRNDYHQSSERILAEPGIEPVLKSATLLTELWGSPQEIQKSKKLRPRPATAPSTQADLNVNYFQIYLIAIFTEHASNLINNNFIVF